MSRFSHALAGGLGALALAAPVAVVSTVTVAAPAGAAPIICERGAKQVEILSLKRPVFLTHVKGFHSPPGGELTITKTVSSTASISASAEVYGEVSGEAGVVFGKVSAKAGFKVGAQGSKTDTTSETVSNKLAASNRDRYYAVYVATSKVHGDFRRRQCRSDRRGFTDWKYGTYRTFKKVTLEGVALCKQARYKKGTAPNAACQATWGR